MENKIKNMILKCLGSESKGNSYTLTSDSGEVLILEAGINIKDVMQSVQFDIDKIVGVCVSHVHL